MQSEDLITLTSDIVAAHVSNNSVAIGDLAKLVGAVHQALASLGQEVSEPVAKTPAVSARASVKDDYLVCMECGSKQKALKRHLNSAHGLSPAEYRADYGLPDSYPMVAPASARARSEIAKASGLGRKAGQKVSRKR